MAEEEYMNYIDDELQAIIDAHKEENIQIIPPRKKGWIELLCDTYSRFVIKNAHIFLSKNAADYIAEKGKAFYQKINKIYTAVEGFDFIIASAKMNESEISAAIYKNNEEIHNLLGKISPKAYQEIYQNLTTDCDNIARSACEQYDVGHTWTFYFAIYFFKPYYTWSMIKAKC